MSIPESAGHCLEILDERIAENLDEQRRQLREVFRRFLESGKGDSCLLTGPRGSGRTLTINRICKLENSKLYKKKVERHILHVAQLGSDTTAQNAVAGDESIYRVIIIEDADELISRQRQTLLYSFLDSTRRNPWLVILMVNRHDFVSSLEKRVRSRLSTSRIIFTGPQKYEDFLQAFRYFLGACDEQIEGDWQKFITNFSENRDVETELKYMFQVSNSFGVLKAAVAIFLRWLQESENPIEQAVSLWKAAVNKLTPSSSPVVNILNGIPLRTFCTFLCVFRRLEKAPPGATVSYGKILVDYKHLCNTADSRMRIGDDSVIFKELDYLVKLRVLFADTKTNNIAFRRVSLHADSFVLGDAVKTRKIPSAIGEWFKTIPVN